MKIIVFLKLNEQEKQKNSLRWKQRYFYFKNNDNFTIF